MKWQYLIDNKRQSLQKNHVLNIVQEKPFYQGPWVLRDVLVWLYFHAVLCVWVFVCCAAICQEL